MHILRFQIECHTEFLIVWIISVSHLKHVNTIDILAWIDLTYINRLAIFPEDREKQLEQSRIFVMNRCKIRIPDKAQSQT